MSKPPTDQIPPPNPNLAGYVGDNDSANDRYDPYWHAGLPPVLDPASGGRMFYFDKADERVSETPASLDEICARCGHASEEHWRDMSSVHYPTGDVSFPCHGVIPVAMLNHPCPCRNFRRRT